MSKASVHGQVVGFDYTRKPVELLTLRLQDDQYTFEVKVFDCEQIVRLLDMIKPLIWLNVTGKLPSEGAVIIAGELEEGERG